MIIIQLREKKTLLALTLAALNLQMLRNERRADPAVQGSHLSV